jgi:hypothetical protein
MRSVIHETDAKHPAIERGNPTIRQAVEWWKDMIRITPMSGDEAEYIDGRWGWIVKTIADREGVPAGWLSYLISEMAYQETRLLETAQAELEQALVTGDEDGETTA